MLILPFQMYGCMYASITVQNKSFGAFIVSGLDCKRKSSSKNFILPK